MWCCHSLFGQRGRETAVSQFLMEGNDPGNYHQAFELRFSKTAFDETSVKAEIDKALERFISRYIDVSFPGGCTLQYYFTRVSVNHTDKKDAIDAIITYFLEPLINNFDKNTGHISSSCVDNKAPFLIGSFKLEKISAAPRFLFAANPTAQLRGSNNGEGKLVTRTYINLSHPLCRANNNCVLDNPAVGLRDLIIQRAGELRAELLDNLTYFDGRRKDLCHMRCCCSSPLR